jgi:hypothetical protein
MLGDILRKVRTATFVIAIVCAMVCIWAALPEWFKNIIAFRAKARPHHSREEIEWAIQVVEDSGYWVHGLDDDFDDTYEGIRP